MKKFLSILILNSSIALAGGGPNEGEQVKINAIPEGYKIVKKDAECTEPDPCAAIKKELDKAKKEIAELRKDNQELRKSLAEADEPVDCGEPKTIIKTKEVKVPVDRIVEKKVDRIVEVPAKRAISIGAMFAYSQDGIETTSDPNEPYMTNAYTYESIIGGPYINFPIGEKFEAGLFGMFGGINKTFGAKLGFTL